MERIARTCDYDAAPHRAVRICAPAPLYAVPQRAQCRVRTVAFILMKQHVTAKSRYAARGWRTSTTNTNCMLPGKVLCTCAVQFVCECACMPLTGITTVTLAGDVLLLLPLPLVADAGGNVAVRGAGARHMYAATTSQMQQPAKLRGVRTMRPITGGHGGCGRQAALTPTPSWHRTGGRRAAWRARQSALRLIDFLKERGLASLHERVMQVLAVSFAGGGPPPRVHGRRRYHMSQRAHPRLSSQKCCSTHPYTIHP